MADFKQDSGDFVPFLHFVVWQGGCREFDCSPGPCFRFTPLLGGIDFTHLLGQQKNLPLLRVNMGQSTPTTTIALDIFLSRYAQFRAELHPREQEWFDELVCRARRHSNAINRRPHLDFERPVFLAMLLEGMRLMEGQGRELAALRKDLEAAMAALREAGIMESRVIPPSAAELGRIGQTVLVEA